MTLRDRLRQATLSVASPTGLLRLEANGSGEVVVSISEGALRGCSERRLEREIAGTVDAALGEARRTYARLRRPTAVGSDDEVAPNRVRRRAVGIDRTNVIGAQETRVGERPDDREQDRRAPDGQSRSRVRAFRQAVNGVVVRGCSRRRYVTIARDEDHRFRARVQPRMLSRLTQAEIADEIRSALADALAAYTRGYERAHRSVFGSDPGFGYVDRRPG